MEFKSGQDHANDKNMLALGVIKRPMTKAERIMAKERAELQKDGKLPPELDAQGNPVNPHVPKFIADAPWYMQDDRDGKASLSHQKYYSWKSYSNFVDMAFLELIDREWSPPNGMLEVSAPVQRPLSIGKGRVRIVVP